jgi:WW domain-containing oxidoreductase
MPAALRVGWGLVSPLAFKSVSQGAATQTWLAAHPSTGALRGAYCADCNVARPSRLAEDAALGERLWEATEGIVARLPG